MKRKSGRKVQKKEEENSNEEENTENGDTSEIEEEAPKKRKSSKGVKKSSSKKESESEASDYEEGVKEVDIAFVDFTTKDCLPPLILRRVCLHYLSKKIW